MQIILTEREIIASIVNEVLSQVNIPDDVDITVDLKATRGAEGYQAFIQIGDRSAVPEGVDLKQPTDLGIGDKVEAAKAEANRPRGRGRPPGSKNLPKDEPIISTKQDPALVEAAKEAEALNEPVSDSVAELIEAVEDGQVEASAPVAAEPAPAPVPTPEPVAEAVTQDAAIEQAKEESAAVTAALEPVEEAPAPATTVQASDVSAQAPEALAANVTETATEQAAVADPTPAPAAAPARSLFANLSDPKA